MKLTSSHSLPARGAFTLLEILIATVCFAIVLAAINGVFYSGIRLRNRSAAALEKSQPLTQALALIKRDLANLVAPGTNSNTLFGQLQSTPSGTGAQTQPRFGSLAGAAAGNGSGAGALGGQVSPDFYTMSATLDSQSPWPTVQKVAYLLVDSTNRTANGKDLVRAVTRNLLPVNGGAEDPVEQLLLPDVADLIFKYHDGTQWQDTWDSTSSSTAPLPRAVKVQLLLATDRDATPTPVELVVPITVFSTNSTSGGTQ
jgi:type II secretory pathway component PulJ